MKTEYSIYFVIILFILSGFRLSGQTAKIDSLTITKDTLQLNEVVVEQKNSTKMSGALSGKIKLHAESLGFVPSMLGNTDLLKILEFTPGIQTAGDANSNLYVRGGDPGQNMLLYEGTVLYTPGHIMSFFPLFNADHISTLEIEKSGVGAEYGGFLSSLINVRSKHSVPLKNSVKGSVGLLSSQITLEGRIN